MLFYRFNAPTNEWKERGTGEIKILVHKETKAARLVMRRDYVLNLCANHMIPAGTNLIPAMNSNKAWV